MSNNTKTFLFVVLAVILVASGLIFLSSRSKKATSNNTASTADNGTVAGASTSNNTLNPDNFSTSYIAELAKALAAKGMVMYGAYWCPHCKDQKAVFGDAFQYVDYVECDAGGPNANPDECNAKGITGYPTWIYNGTKYEGEQSLSKLAQIIGFNSPTDSTATGPTSAQ